MISGPIVCCLRGTHNYIYHDICVMSALHGPYVMTTVWFGDV